MITAHHYSRHTHSHAHTRNTRTHTAAVAKWRIENRHTELLGGVEVHLIGADAKTAHRQQPLALLSNVYACT